MTRLLALLLILVAAAMVVTAVASWISRRKAPRAIAAGRDSTTGKGPDGASKSAEDRAMLLAQLRAMTAVVFSIIMFLTLFRAFVGLMGQVGLPLAFTAGLSASGGLLLFSAMPAVKISAATGSASLVPRTPWHFGSRRTFIGLVATSLSYVAFLVATGVTSSTDDDGRHRLIRLDDALHSSAASPYPGWFYGVPLMAVTLALAASTYLALRRISSTPALPDPAMAVLDRRWREISARVVLRMATWALLGYFGGTAVLAGLAMTNVAWTFDGANHAQPLLGLGIASVVLGAALAVAGVVLIFLALKEAVTIRTAVRQATAHQDAPVPAAIP